MPPRRFDTIFFVYIPTNGRLLTPDWGDRLGDAGVSTFNLAADAVDEKPGLPKEARQGFQGIQGNLE